MSSAFKDLYNLSFYQKLAQSLSDILPDFDEKIFIKHIFNEAFENYELKQRMRHTATVLHHFFPKNFAESSEKLIELIDALRNNQIKENSIEFMFLPEFINLFGLQDLESSIKAMEHVTQFSSCEFAVRPFIAQYEKEMLVQLEKWSKHPHRKVRRLASEGSRPKLPWGMALHSFIKNPQPMIPILNHLKNDTCDNVRKSVSNHLNDISKDHPDLVLDLAQKWKGQSKETDAIIKHALRTLLKKGEPSAMHLFDLKPNLFNLTEFKILSPNLQTNDYLIFELELENIGKQTEILRLEYIIYYPLANGNLSKKIFKISEKQYESNVKTKILRKHHFRTITTKKFYSGTHQVSIVLNGVEQQQLCFEFNV